MSTDFKPAEFVQTMIDVGEAKTKTSTRDLLIRSTMVNNPSSEGQTLWQK